MSDDAASRLRHDLRSSLTAISGFAALLAADGPLADEQRREYARRIQAACDEVTRLVDEFETSR